MASCPECSTGVVLPENLRASEIVECADCHSELEVAVVDPLTLVLAPDVEEDWGE